MAQSPSTVCFHPVTRQWRQWSCYSMLKDVFLKYKLGWKDSELQLSIFFFLSRVLNIFCSYNSSAQYFWKSHSYVMTVWSITPIECGFRICERFKIGEKVRVPRGIPELMRLEIRMKTKKSLASRRGSNWENEKCHLEAERDAQVSCRRWEII